MSDALARAAEVLSGADHVALACHLNPDADALGSMLGLSVYLRSCGVATVCSFGNEPLDPPQWAEMLPGNDALVEAKDFPKEPDVMVTCDTASMDRLGVLARSATHAKELIWIDHHASNEGFGTISIVEPKASSSSELVYRLILAMGGAVTTETAVCLYAGLVTDTGRFQYEVVGPETLRLGAELRSFPFDHARLVQALYENNRAAYLKLLGIALQRLVLEPDADLVWTHVSRADFTEAGVDPSETDDLIDVLRTAREADVAALVKQQRDGRLKVSMRSRGSHDLAKVAAGFGGGGHRLAAGYTSKHGVEETVRLLKAALRDQPVAPQP
jgi:phosphoesterase RecJ-like protein